MLVMNWPLILIIFCGGALLLILIAQLLPKGKSKAGNAKVGALDVARRKFFFSKSESVIYHQLLEILAGSGYGVLAKVRLGDLIEATGANRLATRNRMRDLHVDFVVLHIESNTALFALEVEDENQVGPKASDTVKAQAFRSAGFTLLRAKKHTPKLDLERAVRKAIETPTAPRSMPTASPYLTELDS
jgi:Protein of unknown function (DUF2726)